MQDARITLWPSSPFVVLAGTFPACILPCHSALEQQLLARPATSLLAGASSAVHSALSPAGAAVCAGHKLHRQWATPGECCLLQALECPRYQRGRLPPGMPVATLSSALLYRCCCVALKAQEFLLKPLCRAHPNSYLGLLLSMSTGPGQVFEGRQQRPRHRAALRVHAGKLACLMYSIPPQTNHKMDGLAQAASWQLHRYAANTTIAPQQLAAAALAAAAPLACLEFLCKLQLFTGLQGAHQAHRRLVRIRALLLPAR